MQLGGLRSISYSGMSLASWKHEVNLIQKTPLGFWSAPYTIPAVELTFFVVLTKRKQKIFQLRAKIKSFQVRLLTCLPSMHWKHASVNDPFESKHKSAWFAQWVRSSNTLTCGKTHIETWGDFKAHFMPGPVKVSSERSGQSYTPSQNLEAMTQVLPSAQNTASSWLHQSLWSDRFLFGLIKKI